MNNSYAHVNHFSTRPLRLKDYQTVMLCADRLSRCVTWLSKLTGALCDVLTGYLESSCCYTIAITELIIIVLIIINQQYIIGLDWYQYRVSADTYLSIGANTSSPVVRLPVSAVNTVATHTCSFKPILYFRAYTLHTYITCTHLYPAKKIAFSVQKICTAQYRYRCSCGW